MKFYKKSPKGFTLIELLVVIAIIAMLSAIIVGPIQSARKKARDARRAADLQGLKTALESYFDDNGGYPSTSGSWRSKCSSWGSYTDTTTIPGLTPNYLQSIPVDPLNPLSNTGSVNCLLYASDGIGYSAMYYSSTEPAVSSSIFYSGYYKGTNWGICSGGTYCTSW